MSLSIHSASWAGAAGALPQPWARGPGAPLNYHAKEGWRRPHLRPVLLTKPRLLVTLHLDGEAKVSQLDGSTLQLGCQQQVLGLQREMGIGEE